MTLITLRLAAFSALVLSFGAGAFAQDASKPSVPKWRPKDGVYSVPGPNFDTRCSDQAEAYVELADNLIGGDEYSCKISKMTDPTPGLIRLEAACSDAQTEKTKRELILLRRIDDRTFSWRLATAGAKDPGTKFSYCSDVVQQTYRENEARSKAEAEQKATGENGRQKQ